MLELRVTLIEAQERTLKEAERNSQWEQELFAETEEVRRQQREWKEMVNDFMLKWKIAEDEREKLSDAYTKLQAEGIVTRARLEDARKKEVEETLTQLTKRHEQALALALANAKAKEEQDTLQLVVRQYQENAKIAKAELEANRAQPGMDDTRIKILIDRHRQHLSKKIEEAFGRTGEEWAAQDVELHISRVDAENRRKEGP